MLTFQQFTVESQSLDPELRKHFEKHHATFGPEHHDAISAYKSSLGDVNVPLRNKRHHSNHEMIERLDHVTSKPLEHEVHVFRGFHNDQQPHRMPVGHEFTDRGYTGTTTDPEIAKRHGSFDDQNRKTYGHVVLKPGHYAQHVDLNPKKGYHSEQEVLLHRGTRFQVLGHEEHPTHHIVHLGIVSQESPAAHAAEHAERRRKARAGDDELLAALRA